MKAMWHNLDTIETCEKPSVISKVLFFGNN